MGRYLKILLALSSSLFCLLYGLQNLANLPQATGFVAMVVGMDGHEIYPGHIGPAISSPTLVGAMLAIIIALELAAGALAGAGAVALFRARHSDATAFNEAKTLPLAGSGLAVLLWFGIFSVIGGAYFQMWQTPAGANALNGAFQYAMLNGLAWIMIRSEDQ